MGQQLLLELLTPLRVTPVTPHFLGEGFFRVYWKTSLPPADTPNLTSPAVISCYCT